MKQFRQFLSLVLTLLICLLPLQALAENAPDDTTYNTLTVTLSNLTVDAPSLPIGVLPLSLSVSLGIDGTTLDTLRALFSLSADFDGEDLIDVIGALEDNQLKLHISEMSQDISVPMNQALETLLSEIFLFGEPLSEAPIEFMEAFGALLAEIDALLSSQLLAEPSETPSHYYYSEDDWRSFYTEYPARMRAVPAGEEEITFEGKTYTARKYTYRVDRLTEEEYSEYREGLAITSEAERIATVATAGLEDAVTRMIDIGYEMWEKKYSSASSDKSYAADASYNEVTYSEEGTFYLIDEVMGTLENSVKTIHYPDGEDSEDYVQNVEFISYMTDSKMVSETVSTGSDGSTREVSSVTVGEDGTFTVIETLQQTGSIDYGSYALTYSSDTSTTEIISEDSMTLDSEETIFYSYSSGGTVETESQTTKTHMQTEYLSDTLAEIRVSMNTAALSGGAENHSNISADFTMERGTLPEGTLLRVSGKPFNPLDASEEERNAYDKELSQLLIDIISSIIPPIETPSSVGGALLG